VRVGVDDEGPGVADEERDTIWTPFQRGTVGAQSKAGGSGIGLSVVLDLVREHGGKVWVEKSPSGGARFVAEFNVAMPDAFESGPRDVALHAATVK